MCSVLCWLPSKYRGTITKPVSCQALGFITIRTNNTLLFMEFNHRKLKRNRHMCKAILMNSVFSFLWCCWGLALIHCRHCYTDKQVNMEIMVNHSWFLCLSSKFEILFHETIFPPDKSLIWDSDIFGFEFQTLTWEILHCTWKKWYLILMVHCSFSMLSSSGNAFLAYCAKQSPL